MTGNNRSKGHPPNWFLDTCGQEIFYHKLNLLFTRVTNFDADNGGEDIKRSYSGVKRTIQCRRLKGKHCGDHRTGFDFWGVARISE